MSHWSRVRNVFRGDNLSREIEEEIASHAEEAGRPVAKALRYAEQSRDVRLLPWLDALRADLVFGWRQLRKNAVVSAAAVLSLVLGIGACTAAFRLIDAMLLRQLPVADPGGLYYLAFSIFDDKAGKTIEGNSFSYPGFRLLRDAVRDQADVIAVSYAAREDITFGSDQEMEKAYRQYVSGTTFGVFGLKPALGRLLTPDDDVTPGGHPVAVISYDYWTRRFGRDPNIIGKTFHLREDVWEIVGVVEEGFTGTETGAFTDLFIPTVMNKRAVNQVHWNWFRTWVRPKSGVSPYQVRERLQAAYTHHQRERIKDWPADHPRQRAEEFINRQLVMNSAATGVSGAQQDMRRPLLVLGVVVTLVLLISCANVANLLTAQAAGRAREMALRVSIGAGRWRLVQLVLVESAVLALIASILGALFAWWSAPFVVSMVNPHDNPMRLALPADWRVLGFATALAMAVTFLFGLVPALRASAVKPMNALKGGEDPHQRRRLMHALVAAQVAFCFLVHFVAGLFVATFERLSHQPTGFSSDRVLLLETVVKGGDQPIEFWRQVLDQLRAVAGIEAAAMSGWGLMEGSGWDNDIRIGGIRQESTPYFFSVSAGFFETMKIGMIGGRDFRRGEVYPNVAIVNESFARQYFSGENPIGKSFEKWDRDKTVACQIVGYVRDARYRDMREPIRPTAYVPFGDKVGWSTFEVRTAAANPAAMASLLRKEVPRLRSEFRVSNVQPQEDLVRKHTLRERLLATLSLFFAVVALVLAGVGLYGVLSYSVIQRTREIGIRMALGARPANVVRRVTTEVFAMLAIGSLLGLAAGVASERYIESLLFEVKVTDVTMLATPMLTLLAVALLAALVPVMRAVRIDPAQALRAE